MGLVWGEMERMGTGLTSLREEEGVEPRGERWVAEEEAE